MSSHIIIIIVIIIIIIIIIINKYRDIKNHIKPEYAHFNIELFTLEISVLGFIADCSAFCESLGIGNMPKHVLSSIIRSALASSYNIYCLRNSEEAT